MPGMKRKPGKGDGSYVMPSKPMGRRQRPVPKKASKKSGNK